MSQLLGSSSSALPPLASPSAGCACNASGTSCVDHLLMAACDKVSQSVVHVKFKVKNEVAFRNRVEAVVKGKKDPLRKEWNKKMEEEIEADHEVTTGFVVRETTDSVFILTCAHSMQTCFDASNPLSVKNVNDIYSITVNCDHQELEHLKDRRKKRVETLAQVVHVESKKDLLLLSVDRKGYCNENHPPLKLASSLPRTLDPVGLVSWPLDRHRTTVRGHFSHFKRLQADMNETNHHGYDFSGLEVNITSESGSSGAPLVNLSGDLLGSCMVDVLTVSRTLFL